MQQKIGFVTIGQAPRVDVIPEIVKVVGRQGLNVVPIEKGALDGLSSAEIADLVPASDDDVLVTRLKNGQQVIVGKMCLIPRLQQKINELNQEGVNLIVLLCAGEFPEFQSTVPLIRPDRLLYGVLTSLSVAKVGLVLPSARQLHPIGQKFTELGFKVVPFAVSPYQSSFEVFKQVALELSKQRVDIVVMDCFGYSIGMKQVVQSITQKPVLLVRQLIAETLVALFK